MDSIAGNALGGILVVVLVVIVIFLVCREILCWYWKINQGLTLLTEIRDLLASKGIAQNSVSQTERASASPGSRASEPARVQAAQSDGQHMKAYGITVDGGRYTYNGYTYERLADAVKAVKKRAGGQLPTVPPGTAQLHCGKCGAGNTYAEIGMKCGACGATLD